MKNLHKVFIISGISLLLVSLMMFIYIFTPVVTVELKYNLKKPVINSKTEPLDTQFGIVIPKIGANARVIPDISPYDSYVYQVALSKGVAHALGSAKPDTVGKDGNMFIFSHSSANLLEANRFNSVFYLLSKLNNNDEIIIYYKNIKYVYKVTQIKIVDAKDVSYLSPVSKIKTVTLMTCWPAGTTLKRLIVIATAK